MEDAAMRHVMVVLALVLLAVPVFAGEDWKALNTELQQVRRQVRTAEHKALRTEAFKELKKAEMDAMKELRKATSEIPEVKEVETQLTELRKQMSGLMKKRMELEKKNAEALAEPKKKVADAKAATRKALTELPELQPLYTKQKELQDKLKAARGARQRKPRGEGKNKGPRKARKPKVKKAPKADEGAGENF